MMLFASILKELRLLSRDLHGVAVLFMMPILFMLIMSAALSNNEEIKQTSPIVLLSEPNSFLNNDLVIELQDENFHIEQAELSELPHYKTELQAGKFALIIANPNTDFTALANEQSLQLWLNPSVDRSWLSGVKGVLQKHYTELRLKNYLVGSHITLENNEDERIKVIEDKVNQELNEKFVQINAYLAKDLWAEIYLNRQGKEVTKPNSVQHSVPAWLIFGMFFIMIPLSNVMVMERQTNTITRLRMARASAAKLIVAKLIPYFLINQLQFVGMVALGYFVLPRLEMPAFSLVGESWHYAVLAAAVSLSALG